MNNDNKKPDFTRDITAYLLSQGDTSPLIKLLLKPDTPIDPSIRLLLANMLSETSNTPYYLPAKPRTAQKGRPKKNDIEQVQEVNMGVEAMEHVENGLKYEAAIRLTSKAHNASVPAVEKAYSLVKKKNAE